MSNHGNVGDRRAYETGDQEHYNSAQVKAVGATAGVNAAGYMNKDKAVNDLQIQEDRKQVNDRLKHEPGFAAVMHGNEPSKGAKIDAELEREEAEMLAKKKNTDSMPGKKNESNTLKSEWKQDLDAETKAERTAHSNRGAD